MLKIGSKVRLLDVSGAALGELEIQDKISSAFCGRFIEASGFARVRHIFEEFASLVDQQALSLIDRVDRDIEKLGIYCIADGAVVPLFDIQIYETEASVQTEHIHPNKNTA